MTINDALTQGSDVLTPLIAAIVEQLVMASTASKRSAKILRVGKRKFSRKSIRAELPPSVRERNLAHHRSGKCVCGCGREAGRNCRGLAVICYENFREQRKRIRAERGGGAALDFDREQQLLGRIFPPYWKPDNPFASAREEWEAKHCQVEEARRGNGEK